MNRKSRVMAALVAGVILCALIGWMRSRGTPGNASRLEDEPAPSQPVSGDVSNAKQTDSLHAKRLFELRRDLLAATDPAARRARFLQFREQLHQDGFTAADWLAFLDSGEDAPTGEAFSVGPGGNLRESPTLRVFALDVLGQIAPESAAKVGLRLLTEAPAPDEWAIALRNVARVQGVDDELRGHVLEGLANTEWALAPSVGYLEGFDAAVFSASPPMIPALSRLTTMEYPAATRFAATLALQRSASQSFPALASSIASDPILAANPELRADLFARADLREPDQRVWVATHLSNAATSDAEAEALIRALPNENQRLSNNLLTETQISPLQDLLGEQLQTLAVLQQWSQDPALAARGPSFDAAVQRLQNVTAQAIPAFQRP